MLNAPFLINIPIPNVELAGGLREREKKREIHISPFITTYKSFLMKISNNH